MPNFIRVFRHDTKRPALVAPGDIRYGFDAGYDSLRYVLTTAEKGPGRTQTYIRERPTSAWCVKVTVYEPKAVPGGAS
jgi:hypothetical protein